VTAVKPFDFGSDNNVGTDPRILAALTECNRGSTTPYGMDELSSQVNARYSEIFEREVHVFATPTGTGANGLALGAVTPPYGAIFCHEKAHIVTTECGAPEFFSGGARLVLLPGRHHKITADALSTALAPYRAGSLHLLRPSAISVTQATDGGTTYTCEELAELARVAHEARMKVHMDGARFTNALVKLGVSPAQLTWKSGVDLLSFGMTKNGAMNVEAVICFDPEAAATLRLMHKRAGFLYSKMRFAAAQILAYVADDLWIENARRANANVGRLAAALLAQPGVALEDPIDANQAFLHLPEAVVEKLAAGGFKLRPWPHANRDLFRIVGSYCDTEERIAAFECALGS
jgi:threonine aldolase